MEGKVNRKEGAAWLMQLKMPWFYLSQGNNFSSSLSKDGRCHLLCAALTAEAFLKNSTEGSGLH